MVKIEFATDNAAFEGDDFGAEASDILKTLATSLAGRQEDHRPEYDVYDTNGNRVGTMTITDD